jgi:FAD binding domain
MKFLVAALIASLAAASPHGPGKGVGKVSSKTIVDPSSTSASAASSSGPKVLAARDPHGPGKGVGKISSNTIIVPSSTSASAASSSGPKILVARDPPPAKAKTATPVGCRQIITDESYPSADVWKAELPKAALRNVELEGEGHTEYKIVAQGYQDVIDAVKFAAKHNIRLSVINTGHDFVGRNDAPSGLVIDVYELKGIKVLKEFVPTPNGAEPPTKELNVIVPTDGKQAAVTIGIGISTQVLNDALDKSKLVTVGAAHGSVAAAGGFGQTSGHSPISDLYGLGTDQILEFKVVTPDGSLRVANKVSNQDLFWALRGGGGSTFGVVVEATMKAHPTIPVTVVQWNLNSTTGADSDGIWEAYAELYKHFPDFADNNGMSGYYYHYGTRIGALWLHKGKYAGKANADKIWNPLLEKLGAIPNVNKTAYTVDEYPTFKGYFDARFGAIDKPGSKREPMPWEQSGRKLARREPLKKRHEPFILEKRHEPEAMSSQPVPVPMVNLDSRLLGQAHFMSSNLTAALKAALPRGIEGQPPLLQGHLIGGAKVSFFITV